MHKESKMVSCPNCGAEIAASAKVCPKCGAKNKKPIYKRLWFLILVVLIVIGVLAALFGGQGSDNAGSTPTPVGSTGEGTAQVTYTAYDVSTLMEDLNGNAMKASKKYKDQYVELTGRLNNIDSNGAYFSIVPTGDEYAIIGVQCDIQSEEQKTAVMDFSVGDTIVVKGKITNVGEVFGYSLDTDEVTKAQ